MPVVAPADGLPVAYPLPAGSEADGTGRRPFGLELPAGSGLYPDAGDTDDAPEDSFAEATGCPPLTARRHNSKRPPEPARALLLLQSRHGVETCFRQLTDRFPKRIHATSAIGFVLKIGLFVFVHALDRFGL